MQIIFLLCLVTVSFSNTPSYWFPVSWSARMNVSCFSPSAEAIVDSGMGAVYEQYTVNVHRDGETNRRVEQVFRDDSKFETRIDFNLEQSVSILCYKTEPCITIHSISPSEDVLLSEVLSYAEQFTFLRKEKLNNTLCNVYGIPGIEDILYYTLADNDWPRRVLLLSWQFDIDWNESLEWPMEGFGFLSGSL